jgi:hypothetical protein
MAELVRHRQTKEADTDMFAPKVTAPHLNSTVSGLSATTAQQSLLFLAGPSGYQ